MARRKQATEAATQSDIQVIEEMAAGEGQETEFDPPVTVAPVRLWRENPYPLRTVNLGGTRLVLQESRPDKESREGKDKRAHDDFWQMQIKFGSGSKEDMPSEKVLDYLKSLRKTVTTKEGEEKNVQLFHWSARDRAWGMAIDYDAPRASRAIAEQVYDEVIDMLAREPGVARER
jgi:hypothetical protein